MLRSVLAAMTLGIAPAQPVPAQPHEIPYAAITLVRCGDFAGTAFHIGNGRYITAYHVIAEGGNECTIGLNKVTVAGVEKSLDVAELRGPVIDAKFQLNCSGFKPGHEYLAVGYAGGVYRTNLPLIYSTFGHDPENGNGQFIGADMIPGMSGGPLVGEDYRVSGINLQRWPSRARDLRDTYLCGAPVA
jgi:S1-C subfamily serine protease